MFEIILKKESNSLIVGRIVLTGPRGPLDANLLLDTGAGYSMISWNVAAILGYDVSKSKTVAILTANGRIDAPIIYLNSIAAGDVIVEHIPVICHDIPDITEIVGLLGLNFLEHVCTTIDYRKLMLRIE